MFNISQHTFVSNKTGISSAGNYPALFSYVFYDLPVNVKVFPDRGSAYRVQPHNGGTAYNTSVNALTIIPFWVYDLTVPKERIYLLY